MKTSPIFTGSAVAIITPFKNNKIDYDSLGKIIDFQIENGTDAIVICGTTGEASTLSDPDHLEVIGKCVEYAAGRICIIGGTGSGKSSLVHLIPRFYDATDGEVYLCGKPIRTLSREALLSAVAVVDQRPRLFSGTIRENLLWARGDASDEELWAALEMAQAKDFVKEKPLGLDERVAAGGSNFSGGQRQRLTIARALVARSDILILDDSTSALDFATDAALRRALKSLPSDMTVFIVSQRTGSIASADRILVLDDGALVGEGTHESLLDTCPVCREIYESQFKKEGTV